MFTGPALKTLTAALCTGGALAVATAGPAAAAPSVAVASARPAAPAWGDDSVIWGTVVSATELNLRRHPDTGSAVVYALAPGSQDRIQCKTTGSRVDGTAYWYWFTGAHGWASAAFVDTGGHHVPTCSDPCPGWKSGGGRDGGGGQVRHSS